MRCLFACIGELRSLIAWTWGPACGLGQKALFKPDFHDVQQCHLCRTDSEIASNKSVETTIRKQRIILCSHGAWRIFDRLKTAVALPMRGGFALKGYFFSRLQVRGLIGSCLDIFKRVRILDVQVYENVGKSLIEIFLKGPLTKILRIIFSRRTFIIRIY